MKARVKSNGRIIEVEKGPIGYVECEAANINGFPMQNFYAEDELDFNISAPEKAFAYQDGSKLAIVKNE